MLTAFSSPSRPQRRFVARLLAAIVLSPLAGSPLPAAGPDAARFLTPTREDRPGSWMFWLAGKTARRGQSVNC